MASNGILVQAPMEMLREADANIINRIQKVESRLKEIYKMFNNWETQVPKFVNDEPAKFEKTVSNQINSAKSLVAELNNDAKKMMEESKQHLTRIYANMNDMLTKCIGSSHVNSHYR